MRRLLAAVLLAAAGGARAEWSAEFAAGAAKARAAIDAGAPGAAAVVDSLPVPEKAKAGDRADMLMKRAELKAELRDLKGQEEDLRAALAATPRGFEVLCSLTQFLRERGRLTESLAVAEVLVTVTEGIPAHNRAEKRLQRGETLMRLGRYPEAEADIAQALKDKPEDVPSLWLMAQVLLRAGRAREAVAFSDRMIAASETPAEKARAYSQRAQARESAGDAKGAAEDVARALEADPSDHLALEARVQRLREEGRFKEALSLSDKMVEAGRSAQPTRRALLYEQRAQVKRLLGDAAGAEADLRAALVQEPDSLPCLKTLAEFLLDQSRAGEAVEAATRLLAAAAEAAPPVRAEALLLRGRAYEGLGRSEEASADRAEARRLAPDSAAALRESSRAALAADDVPRALSEAERLIKTVASASAAERAEARLCRGSALLAAGRRAAAEADFLEAVRLSPASLFAREQLVTLALEDSRFEEAETRAEALFSLAGSTSSHARASALILRARARSGRGLQKAAVDDLSTALAADPSSRDALAAMVDALARQGMSPSLRLYAGRLFASAAAAPAGDEAALQTMTAVVTALTRLGDGAPALADAEVLVARSQNAPPARLAESLCARAGALEALDRSTDALADLTRAASLAPAEREPRRRLARLLARLGRTKEALAAADAVVAVSSRAVPAQAADALLWRADRRAEGRDWEGADADHAAAEKILPGAHSRDAEAGARWAAVDFARGGAKAAWARLAGLRTFAGASSAARAALASTEAESRWAGGDAAGAKAAMAAALAADPASACAAPLLGERSSAAAAWFDACVARLPREPGLLTDRGVARWTSGRKADARADFAAALAAKPGFLPAAMSLSAALEADGRRAEGAKVLEAALASPGTDPALMPDARAQYERLKGTK